MTQETYLLSWGIYLVCAGMLLAIFWYMTAAISNSLLRAIFRITAAVLLLMPYSIGDGYTELAPAIIMLAMETVFESSPERVGIPFAIVWGVTICAGSLLVVLRAAKAKKVAAERHLHEDRNELLEESRRIEPTLNS